MLASIACLVLGAIRLLVILFRNPFCTRVDTIFSIVAAVLEVFAAVLGLLSSIGKPLQFGADFAVAASALALFTAAAAFFPKLNRIFRLLRKTSRRIARSFAEKAKEKVFKRSHDKKQRSTSASAGKDKEKQQSSSSKQNRKNDAGLTNLRNLSRRNNHNDDENDDDVINAIEMVSPRFSEEGAIDETLLMTNIQKKNLNEVDVIKKKTNSKKKVNQTKKASQDILL